jgi:hemolysin III
MVRIHREQTLREEVANAITHGLGILLTAVASPFLVLNAYERGGWPAAAGAVVFVAAIVFAYTSSTLYHSLRPGAAKRIFRVLDHTAIFVLIAGTYTPFTTGVLRGAWGWGLFAAVWTLAVVGITSELLDKLHPIASVCLYVAMGWLIVVAIGPLVARVPPAGIALLAAGGLAYTLGVAFYAMRGVRYAHVVWHLFVLAGTSLHFFAVMHYAV